MSKMVIPFLSVIFSVVLSAASAADQNTFIGNLNGGQAQTIVTYGTSLTAGGAWVGQLQIALDRRFPGLAKVINSGAGAMWSKWGVDNLEARVIEKQPDAVLIEFAINDAFLEYKTSTEEARKNLEQMIDRILKARPQCQVILMTMNPPIGVHLERRPKVDDYYDVYRQVAKDRRLLLIDHNANWKEVLQEDAARFSKLVPDGIHPNALGCELVILPQLLKSLDVSEAQVGPVADPVLKAQAAGTIRSELVTVTVEQGRYAIRVQGQATPFASGVLRYPGTIKVVPVKDEAFGEGQGLNVTAANGAGESFQVFPGLPFVLHRSLLVNAGTTATVLNKVPLMEAVLDLKQPVDQLVGLGTGGLKPLAQNVGSYAWMTVADPTSRAGVVGGWLTHERGSGVVFTKIDDGQPHLEARLEYGCLRIEPGQSVVSETFLIGWFADARLGLEAWADAVAKHLGIKLPPMPTVYCTWYDNVHGGASNAKALAELSTFATKALKPYGLSCLQIDDGWQMGDPKGNGPRKNFSAYDPQGPYPLGMQCTAEGLRGDGFTAGLWILPFGGTWNDPFFGPHQDWFVKKTDGKPFDTAWGGTALDMTHPGARAFVKGEIQQAVHDWGYRYLKLDGLSTGAGVQPQYVNDAWKEDHLGDGVFHDPTKTNIQVFRDGLRLIRETAGPQTFILGCCAPQNMRSYAGVFGLVDAMRMGPDNGGNWGSWRGVSPDFGSRNYHLNGRIWWSDPDPIYVRPSINLQSARCIASWNAIAGQMISLSDWLPSLPAERLEIIRRCIPAHGVTARPIDLLQTWPPRQWLVTDGRPAHQRRDVLGFFNWSDKPADLSLTVAGLGLPPADEYVAFDFWNQVLLEPFKGNLPLSVPGAACSILAVRPLLPRPLLISTSRHVSQGILDVKQEIWDAQAKTLAGTSAVVADDVYELRIVARAPEAAWSVVTAEVAAEDTAAGVTMTASGANGLVRAVIKSPVSRDVAWTLRFALGKVADVPPAK